MFPECDTAVYRSAEEISLDRCVAEGSLLLTGCITGSSSQPGWLTAAGSAVSPLRPCSHPELLCVLRRAAWLFLLLVPLPGLWLSILSGTVLFCSPMKR